MRVLGNWYVVRNVLIQANLDSTRLALKADQGRKSLILKRCNVLPETFEALVQHETILKKFMKINLLVVFWRG